MAGGSLYSRPYTKNLYPSWRSQRLGGLPFLGRGYLEAVSRTHCTRGVALSPPSLGALPRPSRVAVSTVQMVATPPSPVTDRTPILASLGG